MRHGPNDVMERFIQREEEKKGEVGIIRVVDSGDFEEESNTSSYHITKFLCLRSWFDGQNSGSRR